MPGTENEQAGRELGNWYGSDRILHGNAYGIYVSNRHLPVERGSRRNAAPPLDCARADPDELALHNKAFNALADAACFREGARDLITRALGFWSNG